MKDLTRNVHEEKNKRLDKCQQDLLLMKRKNTFQEIELLMMSSSGKDVSRAIGPITSFVPHIVDQSVGNHYRGLIKRCAHANKYSNKVMNRFCSFVDRYVRSHYRPIPYRDLTHEYLDTWLHTSKYTLKEKEMYHELLDKFNDPLVNKNKFYRCNSFIKKEYTHEVKEPRIINAPNNMMKTVVGPYIHEIEEHIYDEHFIKHLTPEQVYTRMKAISAGVHRVYETDYSSFEGSFTVKLMNCCEMIMFRRLLSNNPRILRIVENVNLGSRKLYFRQGTAVAHLQGSRLSGAMWTSLANGFTNKMLVEFMVHEAQKTRKSGFQYDYLVEGDDGFIASDVELPVELTEALGFRLKIEEAYDVNGLSFCGLCMGPDGLIPDFHRTIEKFGHTFDDYLVRNYGSKRWSKRRDEMMRAKAMSLLAQSRGVPILQPLALKIIALTNHVKVRRKDFDYWEVECLDILNANLTPKPITDRTRAFFTDRFGLSMKYQKLLEQYINEMEVVNVYLPL